MDPIGEEFQQDHDWEEDSFGDEDYWTVGSLQVVPQSPPRLRPRGGCTQRFGDPPDRGAPKPTATSNRWKVIAPDDDDE